MEIVVEKNKLEKLLKRSEAVADKKASMAILSMSLLQVYPEENLLYITTTDLEQGFKGKIGCERITAEEKLRFCVPCRKFYEIIKDFPEDIVYLIKEDTRLIIRDEAKKEIYELSIADSEEFPNLPDFFEDNLFEIPGKVLSELIEKTLFAAERDSSRFVLSGVYFEPLLEEGKLRAVASDGHRLALLDREVLGLENSSLKEGFIIARKAAERLAELSEEELVIKLSFSNNNVVLFYREGFFFTRTIEGTFPDYRAVIPKEFKNKLKIDRKNLLSACHRISKVFTEKFKPIRFEITSSEVILSSPESELAKAQITLGAEYEGEPLTITFNATYLISALEVMESEEVELKINDERSPTLLLGFRDEGFLYLLMPMVI